MHCLLGPLKQIRHDRFITMNPLGHFAFSCVSLVRFQTIVTEILALFLPLYCSSAGAEHFYFVYFFSFNFVLFAIFYLLFPLID